jgi:hypothetical protein
MNPKDAAIPTAVVIVDTVVVVTVDIIESPAFHDDSRFPFTVSQALIACQCPELLACLLASWARCYNEREVQCFLLRYG